MHQQIRLLLRKLRGGKAEDATLLNEKLLIASTLSLAAPRGEIESLEQSSPDVPPHLTAWHNGLTGAMGALPIAYTEWMIERHYRYGDRSAKAFIDMFGHRLYCLDYLAWQKHHLYALAESQAQTPLQSAVLALTGRLNAAPPVTQTQHMPLQASSVLSMVNLERALNLRFGVPSRIVPFTGGWCEVADRERCQLGGPTASLATAPMLGGVRLEVHSRFDVVLGPMTLAASRRFSPPGEAWRDLWAAIRGYVGPVLDFSVSLTIRSADPYPRQLGMNALGLDLCLGSNPKPHDYQVRLPVPVV